MASIITGSFESQSQSKEISQDLENAGFKDSDYIIYLHDERITKEIKTSIWQYLFKDKTKLDDDSLVVSVKVKGPEEIEKVNEVFSKNKSVHQNYIEHIKFDNAKSLDYLRRIVSLRAKAEIYNSPNITYRGQSSGMNAEVLFGNPKIE